ncbi:MAG TPA: Fe-only nitrogenase accessory AnfO family protein [Methylomusa anaerophila]|uniref:Iron only nitrogenase protein AnfO n=1 Tax=Methylomusa anaerophila TaxID=1930071 RepID=A0A348AFF9_9FIRM|nr:Fe-only nitrogenase accessory AnfO family protein [Methylomusa anaerophila]BBB89807.1 Iron only nitrogenase protein AnfO [Methylomusa anaerophila]HML89147.1 Fe-only nitrogenase accessory AnfO family protein [Methylomusa anaerophila]
MNKEIAVMVGSDNNTCSIFEFGQIVVFGRQHGTWRINRKMPCCLGDGSNMAETRRRIAQIAGFLGECSVFVGLSVSGIPYFELEKINCLIWEIPGKPEEFLDELWHEVLLERSDRVRRSLAPIFSLPEPKGDGRYSLTLSPAEAANAVSMQRVLDTVLRKRNFRVLEISCQEQPVWLDNVLQDNGDLLVDLANLPNQRIHIINQGYTLNRTR